MESLIPVVRISLYAVMIASVFGAVGVVRLQNLFHAALCLVGVLVGAAAVFIGLRADFLAAVQILIYVGAVMTLVIFAIMLTTRLGEKSIEQHNKLGIPSLIACVGLFILLTRILFKTPWPVHEPAPAPTTFDLGVSMMGTYVFPFEVISVILIAIMIGAIVIAKKDKDS